MRPDPTLISIDTFKALVQAAPGEVEGLLKSGAIKRAMPGAVALIQATRAFIEHTRANARSATLQSAQAEAKAARAAASELSLMIERRELLPDHEAQAALDHLAGVIVSRLACIPAATTRDLRARRLIEDTLRSAQAAIANDLEVMSR